MRILRMLCIPFSQQSAGREHLALPDLTRLKPLPCPVPWPYQPLHMGPPSLPYPLALPALPCQTLLLCPVLRPYHPLQVRHPDLYPVPRPYYPSQVGPPLPMPRPLLWPYQPSQVPLHCLMTYAITLVFSFPAPFSYFPLSPSPKGPSSHP